MWAGLLGCALNAVWHSHLKLLHADSEHTFIQHGTNTPTPKDKKWLQNMQAMQSQGNLPVCNNCTKRDIECVWGDTSPRPESTTLEQSMVIAQSSSTKSSLLLWTRGEGSSELLTLELMHHYTTSASYSLFPDPDASTVWRTVIPQMAFDPRNGCLLQAILMFSALHIHHESSTSPRYAEIATDHYTQAKISLCMAEANETVDINAVLVALTLVSQYEFAAAPTVFPFHGNWYNTMCEVHRNGQKNRTETQYSVMQSLQAAIAPPLRPPSLNEPFPSALSSILTSAPDIEELHDASVRPCALIILAHYCVMMKHVTQDGPWWAKKKWGSWLLSQLDPGFNSQDFDLSAWVHVGDGDHF
ncbi:hypothetical protein IW262DRAFT_1506575 [Armillaria fumosa]|nr:hypothetical protein IW262DRAFT_1506575 [Armillaria fumosa]